MDVKAGFTAAVAITALVAGACDEPRDAAAHAEARWAQCTPCHGENGQGNPAIEAPPIAGLPAWYVEEQLWKFRIGARGTHFDDLQGMRMRPMALALPSDEIVRDIAGYVASLPPVTTTATTAALAGDAAKGQALYAVCIACHGADGGGNVALGAPAIAGLPDWYAYLQLKKFKDGVRGTHPRDTRGATMRAIAMTLTDEQAMKDVTAYVSSLPRKGG